MKQMSNFILYTAKDFNNEYQDDEACLEEIFRRRYESMVSCPDCGEIKKFYKVSNRKCFACQFCGYQLHPLANTIFHKSSTPLKLWFYAIYLMSYSGKGIPVSSLSQKLGVTYKTAWRMAKEIHKLQNCKVVA